MGVIGFRKAKCKDCYKCVRLCEVKAIRIKDEHAQFVAVIFFSCFETNLSDEDIWTIVEIIINDDDSDRELLYTKMREKAAEENNRFYILENL